MKIKYSIPDNPRIVSQFNNFPFGCGEIKNFIDICREIQSIKNIDNTIWYADPDYNSQNAPEGLSKEDIVFYKGDEHYRVPPWHKDCKLILKHTVRNDFPENIIHIPFLYTSDCIRFPYVPFNDRKIDVFFTGTCWPETNRKFIIDYLKSKLKGVNFILGDFINPKEYYYILANTKISLCLDGKWTPECYRFSESIQAGSLAFSSDLSYSKLFDNCPYIKMDWSNLDQVIDQIYFYLTTKNSEEISIRAHDFWQNKWHPKKWAELILSRI
jgi:hypothetical protein